MARYFAHVIVSRCNRRKDIKRRFLPARNVNTSVKRRGCFARIRLIPANTRRWEAFTEIRRPRSLFRAQKLLLAKTGQVLNRCLVFDEKWQVLHVAQHLDAETALHTFARARVFSFKEMFLSRRMLIKRIFILAEQFITFVDETHASAFHSVFFFFLPHLFPPLSHSFLPSTFFYISHNTLSPLFLSHISSLSRTTDCIARYIELLRSHIDNMSLARNEIPKLFYTVTFVQSFAFNAVCTLSFNFTRWDYSAAGIVTALHPSSSVGTFRKKVLLFAICIFSRGKV